jgi:hypothetical protein
MDISDWSIGADAALAETIPAGDRRRGDQRGGEQGAAKQPASTASTQTWIRIGAGEPMTGRGDVVISGTDYILRFPIVSAPRAAGYSYFLGHHAGGGNDHIGAPNYKSARVRSDSAGLFNSSTQCFHDEARPNVNWTPGARPAFLEMVINRADFDRWRQQAGGAVEIHAELKAMSSCAAPTSIDDSK